MKSKVLNLITKTLLQEIPSERHSALAEKLSSLKVGISGKRLVASLVNGFDLTPSTKIDFVTKNPTQTAYRELIRFFSDTCKEDADGDIIYKKIDLGVADNIKLLKLAALLEDNDTEFFPSYNINDIVAADATPLQKFRMLEVALEERYGGWNLPPRKSLLNPCTEDELSKILMPVMNIVPVGTMQQLKDNYKKMMKASKKSTRRVK